jgi:hypothetical protein
LNPGICDFVGFFVGLHLVQEVPSGCSCPSLSETFLPHEGQTRSGSSTLVTFSESGSGFSAEKTYPQEKQTSLAMFITPVSSYMY